jgi:hypothetical protein
MFSPVEVFFCYEDSDGNVPEGSQRLAAERGRGWPGPAG